MKKILILVLLFGFGWSVNAQEKSKNAKHVVEVNGNCGMCKKRIEKAALGVSGVKMANWDSKTRQLSIVLNEEKSSVQEVEKAVAGVGHDTPNSKADQETYENLHHCCKYERN